jgi:hypothetical protein
VVGATVGEAVGLNVVGVWVGEAVGVKVVGVSVVGASVVGAADGTAVDGVAVDGTAVDGVAVDGVAVGVGVLQCPSALPFMRPITRPHALAGAPSNKLLLPTGTLPCYRISYARASYSRAHMHIHIHPPNTVRFQTSTFAPRAVW